MGDVIGVFADPMRLIFGDPEVPKGTTVDAFYEALLHDLTTYSNECLKLASDNIRTNRKWRSFPTIAECVEACKEANDQLLAKHIRNAPPPEVYPEWTKTRIEAANRMICGSVARTMAMHAAEHGWILRLHDFCREKNRLPQRHEADRLRRRFIEDEKRLEETGVPPALRSLREAMLKRRAELAAMVKEAALRDGATHADQAR